VAALFALHPLHVESVAWIAERKDVLSALFWMLTLGAYARYVARPGPARYACTLLAFGLGLMAKPMLVTLPLVLLLLDYWPFARGFRIREKLPFLALSAAASVVTYMAHAQAKAVVSLETIPLGMRVENALISCAAYIGQMFWPSGLAVFYPYPSGRHVWQAALAGAGIAAVTAVAIRMARKRPYLIVGWLWFLVTLAPVIGLIQAGQQSRADRYMYIPMIGLSIALVWGAAELLQARPQAQMALAGAVCLACAALTWTQVGYWEDGVKLFQRAVDVTGDNYVARFNLAHELREQGDDAGAVRQLEEAVRIRPDSGLALVQEALELAEKRGLRCFLPEFVRLKGELLLQRGDVAVGAAAEACFAQALEAARPQGARTWELRAAMSMARLWQRYGRCEDARALLAGVYDWFTEGFDTPDLRDARALLAELSGAGGETHPYPAHCTG